MRIMNIVFKHPVAFIYTSYTLYSVFNATLHLHHQVSDAGAIAGLNVLQIINEPTVAAIACNFKNKVCK
jgi:hypothetical protein